MEVKSQSLRFGGQDFHPRAWNLEVKGQSLEWTEKIEFQAGNFEGRGRGFKFRVRKMGVEGDRYISIESLRSLLYKSGVSPVMQ